MINPPRFFRSLFQKLCKENLFEELHGDLFEDFIYNTQELGIKKARNIYRKEVIKLIRPSVVKSITKIPNQLNRAPMFKSHLVISLRNILRHKGFSAINVVGLSLCISTGLLVLVMLLELNSFDNFHDTPEDLYRVTTRVERNGNATHYATTPAPLNYKVSNDLAAITQTTKIQRIFNTVESTERRLNIDALYADDGFLELFNFPIVKGNSNTPLNKPNSIVLSRSFSKKLFPKQDPIGQTLKIEGLNLLNVTAIVEDAPKNSHLKFDALITFASAPRPGSDWSDISSLYTYIRKNAEAKESEVQDWLDRLALVEYKDSKSKITFELQPINNAITGKQMANQIGTVFPNAPILILTIIGIAIILTGAFNYTNLSIARALTRMKEVGIRKTIGGSRAHIFWQYISETIIISLCSYLVALGIFLVIRDSFLQLFWAMSSLFELQLTPKAVLIGLGFSVLVGLLGGIYPAMLYSRINMVKALKGLAVIRKSRSNWGKNTMTILQFSLVFVFIIVGLNVRKQYRYTLNSDPGLNPTGIVTIPLSGNDAQNLVNSFSALSGVESVALSSGSIGNIYQKVLLVESESKDSISSISMAVSENFAETYEIKVLSGRNLTELKNPNAILVNERFVKVYFNADRASALDKQFLLQGNLVTISGIVEDFRFSSPTARIAPLVLYQDNNALAYLNIKLNETYSQESITRLETVWNSIDPINPMQAVLLTERMELEIQFLKEVMKASSYVGIMLAIVSCLGLLGMLSYQIEIRLKELGVRKVLGASSKQLIAIISKNSIILISVAAILGLSLAYLVLDKAILATFYDRIKVGPIDLLSGVLLVAVIIGIFLYHQLLKVTRTNPAEVLKQE